MRYSGFLSGSTERATRLAERAEEAATRANPPLWQLIVLAVVILMGMRLVVVAV